MQRDEFLGVWRLEQITARGKPVLSGQSHLVVLEQQLWEVWPKSVYYEGEPGPERTWRFTAGHPARLEVELPHGCFCYLLRRSGDALSMRLGGVFGQFPSSMDDPSGNLYRYTRETREAAERLREPPPRQPRSGLEHPALGRFVFDANLGWWTGETELSGQKIEVHVDGPTDASVELLDRAQAQLGRLDTDALAAYAATKLLELHNENWNDGDPIDATAFRARLSPRSLTLGPDGGGTLWFDDGDLFYGHTIFVSLSADLEPTDAGF